MPEFVSPFASAVTENRQRPFSIRPLPNRTYKLSKYPALQWTYLTLAVGFRVGFPAWIATWHRRQTTNVLRLRAAILSTQLGRSFRPFTLRFASFLT